MRFEPMKAIEAAAVIARREGKRISRMRLLKLLYIAERKLAKSSTRRLLNDRLVAMDHGPLHSNVYDMIKGSSIHAHMWSKHFTNVNPRVLELTEEPELHLLSRLEVDCLNKAVDENVNVDVWELSTATHEFQEWKDSYRENSSSEIVYKSLMEAVGRTSDFEDDIKESNAFTEFFEKEI